jgi:predicted double-glycine peptidase
MNENERSCNKYDHYARSLANQPNHAKFKDFERQEESGWCGPACLAHIAKYEGLHYTQAQLARILGTNSEDGTSHYQMFCGALEIGLQATQVRDASLDMLAEVLPNFHVIVNWMTGTNEAEDGHYDLIKDITKDMVHLQEETMFRGTFEKYWYDIGKEGRVNRWAMLVKRTDVQGRDLVQEQRDRDAEGCITPSTPSTRVGGR